MPAGAESRNSKDSYGTNILSIANPSQRRLTLRPLHPGSLAAHSTENALHPLTITSFRRCMSSIIMKFEFHAAATKTAISHHNEQNGVPRRWPGQNIKKNLTPVNISTSKLHLNVRGANEVVLGPQVWTVFALSSPNQRFRPNVSLLDPKIQYGE